MPVGAAIGGVAGGALSFFGARSAANTQAQAAREGTNAQLEMQRLALEEMRRGSGEARNVLEGYLPQSIAALREGTTGASNALTDYYNRARTDVTGYSDRATSALQPYADLGRGATQSLAQLYGLPTPGSPQGSPLNQLEALRQSPEYNFAMTEGNRALGFSNAAKGLLQSRGHLNDTVTFGQGLASNQFGNYFNRLMALTGVGQNAATSQAGFNMATGNTLAGLTSGAGNALAGFRMGEGTDISRLLAGTGSGIANALTGQSNNAANIYNQMGQTQNAGLQGAGQAVASGIVGGTNAVTGATSGLTNNLMLYNYINRMQNAQQPNMPQQTWRDSPFLPSNWNWNTVNTPGYTAQQIPGATPFNTAFADGGEPPVGVPSMVGERGPEMFVPTERGIVIPNELLAMIAKMNDGNMLARYMPQHRYR